MMCPADALANYHQIDLTMETQTFVLWMDGHCV